MRIDVLTLFPGMFAGPLEESILKRAREQGILTLELWNPREFTEDRHRIVDDTPFGGGPGMVMKPEPIYRAFQAVLAAGAAAGAARADQPASQEAEPSGTPELDPGEQPGPARPTVILTAPAGRRFDQREARRLAGEAWLVFICGHYEGVDERVAEATGAEPWSIGDYVLTGGELAAMVMIDAICRLVPGVLGDEGSCVEESFEYDGLLEYPHYTRPREFLGLQVPEVLLSGHHEEIRRWRRRQAILRTLRWRPDLLERAKLTEEERLWVQMVRSQGDAGAQGAPLSQKAGP